MFDDFLLSSRVCAVCSVPRPSVVECHLLQVLVELVHLKTSLPSCLAASLVLIVHGFLSSQDKCVSCVMLLHNIQYALMLVQKGDFFKEHVVI